MFLARLCYRSIQTVSSGKKTALYNFHVENGGKMVQFAGWQMPLQYVDSPILASHLHTRTSASLFDVSHMLQIKITGNDRIKFIESLTVGDFKNLKENTAQLSVFTNEKGGIMDDTVIMRLKDSLYVVSNAGCSEKISAHFLEKAQNFDVRVEFSDNSLLALQGPKAAKVLERISGVDLSKFPFMTGREMKIDCVDCFVTRSGYTGEDGFEISVPKSEAERIAKDLLASADVKLAGLGARDSLRLEAGLCLYGHDLNEDISPVEAGLTWTIGKRRREEGGFPGFSKIAEQIASGPPIRRIGLVVENAPARENAEIFDTKGSKIGTVTSGCPSPSLKRNIAMGYVRSGFHKVGTELNVSVRGKMQKAVVTKMPFVEAKYYKL